jgi:hypothetical protein
MGICNENMFYNEKDLYGFGVRLSPTISTSCNAFMFSMSLQAFFNLMFPQCFYV